MIKELQGTTNLAIVDMFAKADSVINNPKYRRVMCSISGGSDSDVMMDLLTRVDREKKVTYVFFDTGLEYEATKRHLQYLEKRYGVEIMRERAKKPIPTCSREYGQPFVSKQVSEFMQRLQSHGFKWEDEPFSVLYERYPKCKAALKWWCNEWGARNDGGISSFDIARNKWLKEFIVQNPPDFAIANKCCTWAKKKVAHAALEHTGAQLNIMGVRRAEGGARATAYKNCITLKSTGIDDYRPLFWLTDADKAEYERLFGVVHSACYTDYGLPRTGCAGCPFGRSCLKEVDVIQEHEPRLHKAVNKIFGRSYEYTQRYREFAREMGGR